MNVKTTAPLAVAGLLGLVAAIVASQIINQKTVIVGKGQTMEQALDLAPVVVAKHDVPPGGTLTLDDLTVAHIDAKTAPTGPSVCADPALLVGRVAKIQIPRGQIVHEALLAEKGVSGGLPGVIPAGYRAMTLEINEFSGVAGLLEPGDHIDILARVAESGGKDGNAQMMTRTVVQNVQIIAVGPSLTNKNAASPDPAIAPVVPDAAASQKPIARSVTLVVTPENAEKIDLAASTNQTRLVLRASTDNATATLPGATLASIRGNVTPPPITPLPGNDVATASAPRDPANDAFGPNAGHPTAAKPPINTRPITIIRAGVPSQIEVEVPSTLKASSEAAEPTASAAN